MSCQASVLGLIAQVPAVAVLQYTAEWLSAYFPVWCGQEYGPWSCYQQGVNNCRPYINSKQGIQDVITVELISLMKCFPLNGAGSDWSGDYMKVGVCGGRGYEMMPP